MTIIVSLRSGLLTASCALLLSGCGLAETTAVAATEASSAAEQVKQGKEMEAKVQRDVEAANKLAAEQRDKAEADSQ